MKHFQPSEQYICIGQPTEEEARALIGKFKPTRWLNLRKADEQGQLEDPNGLLETLGVEYLTLPTSGKTDINFEHASKLDTMINAAEGSRVIVQCGSSNRVGALLALIHFQEHKNLDEALRYGRLAGLTSLEQKVREILLNTD